MSPPSSTLLPGSYQCLPMFLTVFARLFARSLADRSLRRCRRWPGRSRTRSPNSPMTIFPTPTKRSARSRPSGNPLAFPSSARCRTAGCRPIRTPRRFSSPRPTARSSMPRPALPVDKLPDGAAAVRLNNRLRRTVEAALGGLTLLSPDPAKRIAAAQSVFKTPRRERAAGRSTARSPRKPTRPPRQALHRGARRHPALSSRTPPRSTSSKPSPSSRRAATRKRWRC